MSERQPVRTAFEFPLADHPDPDPDRLELLVIPHGRGDQRAILYDPDFGDGWLEIDAEHLRTITETR